MFIKVVLAAAAAVVGVAYAAPAPRPEDTPQVYGPPPPSYGAPHQQPHKEEPPRPYAFEYGVQDDYSGASYGHNENSDGSEVKGSYQVALPDGRIQTVNYVADHYNGFQAEVEYQGKAQYPETESYPAPAYAAPRAPAYPAPAAPAYTAPAAPAYPAPAAPAYPAPAAPAYPAPDPVYDATAPIYSEEPVSSEYN